MVLNIGGDVLEEGAKEDWSNRSGTEYWGDVLEEGAKEDSSNRSGTEYWGGCSRGRDKGKIEQ